ncbi:hypothetical protein [Pyxidicoccus xibeiensis]|uniref:hypothetical protein n=1 Tax=Pyxidicoccus xibeiensis TaxID=2906759 RepID=UPI0020A710B6|nr:hypothetical protein [Pyxidicoccus xibeiensis]MCP3142912.1 hypothetical protein [Pyxidicoccus xibeiensis]
MEQYLGCADDQRDKQLNNLQFIIYGYTVALKQHQLGEPTEDFLSDFAHSLRKKFGGSMSTGPIAAIRRESKNDEVAWSRFWILVWEFSKSLGMDKQA